MSPCARALEHVMNASLNLDSLDPDGLENSWPSDREERADPQRLTGLFHSSVPILKHLNWRVTDTARGFAETVLPISVESTNQHIKHQAAVMLIAADYTGGIALGTLLHAVPLVGIHPQSTEYGAYLWGAKADIKWVRPSTKDLICTAIIDPQSHGAIAKRFFSGRRVLETVRVEMRNGSKIVAEANITYWVQDTDALRRNAFDEEKVHPLYDHRRKTSASLIAGLRAIEDERPCDHRLLNDPAAKALAGDHGVILARRVSMVAPQIQPMVVARTNHVDELIRSIHRDRPCQVVNIGVGLCSRILRLALPEGSATFDLDLPIMLRARREALDASGRAIKSVRYEIPADLRSHDIAQCVRAHPAFDPHLLTVVIWEGGTMYFDESMVGDVSRSAKKLLVHPDSRLWFDYVHRSVVDGSTEFTVVRDFLDAMRSLGEPFTCGFDEIGTMARDCGLDVETDVPSISAGVRIDPVFDLYRFATLRTRRPVVQKPVN